MIHDNKVIIQAVVWLVGDIAQVPGYGRRAGSCVACGDHTGSVNIRMHKWSHRSIGRWPGVAVNADNALELQTLWQCINQLNIAQRAFRH